MGYRRISASAVAARMAVSISVAALVVMSMVVPAPTVLPEVRLSVSSVPCTRTDVTCALILGGTTVSTPDDAYVETVKNHFIAPTHPGQIDYVAVTTPMEAWPATGIGRLIWLAVGPPSIWGPGGPAWPAEPWWKLSGLFDLTFDQSVQAGVSDLEDAIAKHPNDHLVIYGYSQGAIVANLEKQKLAEQYPAGTQAPDIDFVLSGDLNLPNGGLASRFAGLYIPILDVSFSGPAPTDTQFDTVEINRQYDGFADFPLYPLNVVSLLNALLGAVYLHPYDLDVSLADDTSGQTVSTDPTGRNSYYFFPTDDLPLFAPLRTLGVPEPVIDVVEPVFKVIVELGYDRSIPPWEPTPARLIPPLDPGKVAADLVNAIGEGITNALALTGSPPLLKIPAPGTSADTNEGSDSPDKVVDLNAFGDGIANSLSALNPFSTDQGNKQSGTDGQNSGPQSARWTKLTPKSLTDGFKFTPLKPRSSTGDNQTGGPVATVGANVSDWLQQVGQNVETTIKKATDSVTKGFSGFNGHKVDSQG